MTEKKSYNLASLSKEEMDKVNVDLVASGVAYKERINQPVIAEQVEREQPEHLRDYFRERVAHYREVSKRLPTGSAPVYLQMAEANGKK
ncbi:DNA polymerase III subunit theta [Serratia quinivorans]|uniref:DNA polymerase III subunit theta n=1 Tax=Serratia TaxID=613 RepID=UPI002178EA27|nr:DNA polymerase III subunit theta [Serratia quinivorans]CAI0709527.1 DNA polymerase III subunit theta [Serratia quinivorans]